MTKKDDLPKELPADDQQIEAAISEGKKLIDAGSTKIAAAMHIYGMLLGHPQETIVNAFIKGASLTEKGALTYWYNCRRKYTHRKLDEQS